jgi:replicative DNA helicase
MNGLWDQELEGQVLASVILSPGLIEPLTGSMGVRPRHFYDLRHGLIFEAMVSLADRGDHIDHIGLRHEIGRLADPHNIRSQAIARIERVLVNVVSIPAAANIRHRADKLIELATWRQRLLRSQEQGQAAINMDLEAWAAAERTYDAPTAAAANFTAEAWGEQLVDWLGSSEPDDAIALPFLEFSEALDGGLRAGDFMVIAGYTSHGKTIFADMILDKAAADGHRCHLYMTEMTARQRGLRMLARHTGIPVRHLRRRSFNQDQWKTILAQAAKVPYGCTVVADQSIHDVCRDIRRAGWDLAVIDLLHGFPYSDERDLSEISGSLKRCANGSTLDGGGTAIVATAHLNEIQVRDRQSPARPKPGLQSIKGASSIKQDADIVAFVWLQDDDRGVPTTEGAIWLAKARSGDPNAAVNVELHLARIEFMRAAHLEAVA